MNVSKKKVLHIITMIFRVLENDKEPYGSE